MHGFKMLLPVEDNVLPLGCKGLIVRWVILETVDRLDNIWESTGNILSGLKQMRHI
jgi:hypothetical protein